MRKQSGLLSTPASIRAAAGYVLKKRIERDMRRERWAMILCGIIALLISYAMFWR